MHVAESVSIKSAVGQIPGNTISITRMLDHIPIKRDVLADQGTICHVLTPFHKCLYQFSFRLFVWVSNLGLGVAIYLKSSFHDMSPIPDATLTIKPTSWIIKINGPDRDDGVFSVFGS